MNQKSLFGFVYLSAALMGSTFSIAEPLVVESTPDVVNDSSTAVQVVKTQQPPSQNVSELLFQQQIMQQEISELRGQVEELLFQIQQMKKESKDRYIDLDRRITESQSAGADTNPAVQPRVSTNSRTASNNTETNPVAVDPAAEKQAYDDSKNLIREKKYSEAISSFQNFISTYPDSDFVANSWYWMGEVYLVQRDLESAQSAFDTVYRQYPNHQKFADAAYKLGVTYTALGDKDRAKVLLNEVITKFGGTLTGRRAKAALDKIK